MARPQRALSLHHSALSDAEYKSYTSSLSELISDPPGARAHDSDWDWDNARISVRETRGWLRGKYGDVVGVARIDQILNYFHHDTNPLSVLTGGEYFAVLRLANHVRNGKDPDRELVFVQAPVDVASPPATSNPFNRSPIPLTSQSQTFSPSLSDAMSEGSFTHSTGAHSARSAPSSSQPFSDTSSPQFLATRSAASASTDISNSSNPFLTRSKTISVSLSPVATNQLGTPTGGVGATPPLPPRKPAKPLLPPPRHVAISQATLASPGLTKADNGGGFSPTHPKVSPSPLIQQSLKVAKAARAMVEMEKSLANERMVEVISRTGDKERERTHGHSQSLNGIKYYPSSSSLSSPMPPPPPPPYAGPATSLSNASSSSSSSRSRSPLHSASRLLYPATSNTSDADRLTTSSFEHVASAKIPTLPFKSASSYNSLSKSKSDSGMSTPTLLSPAPAPATTAITPAISGAKPPLKPKPGASTVPDYLTSDDIWTEASPFDSPPTSASLSPSVPTNRPQRSASLHYAPSSSSSRSSSLAPPGAPGIGKEPPLPPPRRKRPESVQVFPSSTTSLALKDLDRVDRDKDTPKEKDSLNYFNMSFKDFSTPGTPSSGTGTGGGGTGGGGTNAAASLKQFANATMGLPPSLTHSRNDSNGGGGTASKLQRRTLSAIESLTLGVGGRKYRNKDGRGKGDGERLVGWDDDEEDDRRVPSGAVTGGTSTTVGTGNRRDHRYLSDEDGRDSEEPDSGRSGGGSDPFNPGHDSNSIRSKSSLTSSSSVGLAPSHSHASPAGSGTTKGWERGGATLSDQGYFKGETGVATGVNGSLDGWTVLR